MVLKDLPALAHTKTGDVGHVVASVPRVESEILFEGHRSQLRMAKRTLPVRGAKRAEQPNPTFVQGVEERKRNFDWSRLSVGQFGPAVLGIGFDRRLLLRQSELEAHVGI